MVFLKEALPNPVGEDTGGEWIKLVNIGDNAINLTGWSIKDASEKTYTLNASIDGKTELLLEHSLTGITLNNTNETITLLDASGVVIDSLTYNEAGDDEIIIANRFVETSETEEADSPTLNELAINGNGKIISGGDISTILVAVAIALISGVVVGVFIKKSQEK